MMSPSNQELQRLLHLLAETATKAEQEAYAAGWRDCHAAMTKALAAVSAEPHPGNGLYSAMPEMSGAAAEPSYAN